MSQKSLKLASTELASITLEQDGIIAIRFVPEYDIQLSDILEIQQGIISLDASPRRILVVPGKYGSISKDARNSDMFENHPAPSKLSVAIIGTQLHQRILGTMYFKFINKKYYHYKFFKIENDARTWLLGQ